MPVIERTQAVENYARFLVHGHFINRVVSVEGFPALFPVPADPAWFSNSADRT